MATTKNNLTMLLPPTYWLAWLGLGLLWLIIHLPCHLRLFIGRCLGLFLYYLPTQLGTITRINIKLCFPEWSKQKRKQLTKESFASLGIGLIEIGMAWWLPDEKLNDSITIQGLEHLKQAYTRGKGVILLGPHATCLEIVGRLLRKHYAFAVMYRPHKKRFIRFIHERYRQQHYMNYIPRQDMRQLLRTLKQNMAIWYAYDVDGGQKRSVFAPFFGIPTASLTAVSRIVQLSKAAVVPIHFYRRPEGFQYEVILSPALEDFPSHDCVEDATRLNAALEKAIRAHPDQYIWQYKRFKTRPPGEKRVY